MGIGIKSILLKYGLSPLWLQRRNTCTGTDVRATLHSEYAMISDMPMQRRNDAEIVRMYRIKICAQISALHRKF